MLHYHLHYLHSFQQTMEEGYTEVKFGNRTIKCKQYHSGDLVINNATAVEEDGTVKTFTSDQEIPGKTPAEEAVRKLREMQMESLKMFAQK